MAKKISELDPITGANTATGDLIPIVDVSGNVTGHITRAELIEAIAQNLITLNASGVATLGGLTVDTDTLHVDTVNNRVGFGTLIPAVDVHIASPAPTIRLEDDDLTNIFAEISGAVGSLTFKADANNAQAGTTMRFFMDGVEAYRIDANRALLHGTTVAGSAGAGDIVVNGGIFLGGSAVANKLGDYEEGTWTPILSDGVNSDATYTAQVGHYVRIGNSVHIQCKFTISSLGSISGPLQVDGLPFISHNVIEGSSGAPVVGAASLNITAGFSIVGEIRKNTAKILLNIWDVSTGTTGFTSTELSNNGNMTMSAEYITA